MEAPGVLIGEPRTYTCEEKREETDHKEKREEEMEETDHKVIY